MPAHIDTAGNEVCHDLQRRGTMSEVGEIGAHEHPVTGTDAGSVDGRRHVG